jgi:hypothetical protein
MLSLSFFAFSLREPVPTSLENALEPPMNAAKPLSQTAKNQGSRCKLPKNRANGRCSAGL